MGKRHLRRPSKGRQDVFSQTPGKDAVARKDGGGQSEHTDGQPGSSLYCPSDLDGAAMEGTRKNGWGATSSGRTGVWVEFCRKEGDPGAV